MLLDEHELAGCGDELLEKRAIPVAHLAVVRKAIGKLGHRLLVHGEEPVDQPVVYVLDTHQHVDDSIACIASNKSGASPERPAPKQ